MKIIGIDLGTTNSCVYYLDDEGNPVLVIDKHNRKIFPSAVWSSGPGQEVVVGHRAKSRLGQRPAPVIAAKRKMGTNETVSLGGEQVTPVQVSAHILTYAKELVEEVTGDRVGGVVVTMPAYFDSAPKQDTCKAAVEAFFGGDEEAARNRLAVQLEPEAAAYAYTIEDPAERLKILVYDLGGGTFDVTILEKSPEAGLTVLKFGGDPHLGGDNVDDRIAAWILYLLRGGKPEVLNRILESGRYSDERRYTVLQQILTDDVEGLRGELYAEDRDLLIGPRPPYALKLDSSDPEDLVRVQKLKSLAEKAKMDLTVSTEATITQQGAFEDQEGEVVDIDLTLSRKDFNLLIGDMVARTIEETSRVINESGLRAEQLDQILLVGGSSRMPVIAEELQRAIGRPIKMKDPDLIVARGAALRARELNPRPLPKEGVEERVTVEYPRQTPDRRVSIKGQVSQPLTGYQVYVSRDGEDVADAPVNEDRFIVKDVPLIENEENRFHLEIADQDENIFTQTEVTIRHNPQAVGAVGSLSTKITKPVRILGVRGFKTVFAEGELIPAEEKLEVHRATSDNFINIPFYEGERWLEDLRIEPVDPSLPLNAAIDLRVTFNKDYTVNATGTVRVTKQSQSVKFRIPHIEIPSPEKLDDDLEDVLEQLDNDLPLVRDPNVRAKFSNKRRRLEAEYRKARRELTPDLHNLYTIVGELRKILVEVRGIPTFLEPPFEVFERIVNITRRQAQELDETTAIPKRDALDKIAALERAGKDAWEREDVVRWKSITRDLEKLKDDIERAMTRNGPPPRDFPPEVIQREMLSWLDGLREKVSDNHLEAGFSAEIDKLESLSRHVDLRHADQARDALLQLVQDKLNPLEYRIDQAIQKAGVRTNKDGEPTTDTGKSGQPTID